MYSTVQANSDLTYILVLSLARWEISSSSQHYSGCHFPQSWRGKYFLSGERHLFKVSRKEFGSVGICQKQHEFNKFTIVNRKQKCFHCLSVWPRHENAIQFKLSPCRNKQEHKNYGCQYADTARGFKTLVKLGGPDTECPFTGM